MARRPTFGISLGPDNHDYGSMVYRPKRLQDGIQLRITDITSVINFAVRDRADDAELERLAAEDTAG